jgi:hypothetical protein
MISIVTLKSLIKRLFFTLIYHTGFLMSTPHMLNKVDDPRKLVTKISNQKSQVSFSSVFYLLYSVFYSKSH